MMIEEKNNNETINDENACINECEAKADKKKSEAKSDIKKLACEIDRLTEENKKLNDKLSEENDKYLRMLAEYDNFRRRSQKDRENVYADAYGEALSELLPVLDNIERAVQFADSDNVSQGMSMIVSQVKTALEKLGIETFGEIGETFDPNIHNAVMHVDDESMAENVIADIFQRGYKKGDRIIRHAMVKVAN